MTGTGSPFSIPTNCPTSQWGTWWCKGLHIRKKIVQENDISIRSLYRYEKAYREGQFSSLKPITRKNTDHRSFWRTLIFCSNRQSSSGKKSHRGLSHRSSISWNWRVMLHWESWNAPHWKGTCTVRDMGGNRCRCTGMHEEAFPTLM